MRHTINIPLNALLKALGVTLEELRGAGRERRLADARTLVASALPLTQEQTAVLLNRTRQYISYLRKHHKALLASDPNYRAQWERINENYTKTQTI